MILVDDQVKASFQCTLGVAFVFCNMSFFAGQTILNDLNLLTVTDVSRLLYTGWKNHLRNSVLYFNHRFAIAIIHWTSENQFGNK